MTRIGVHAKIPKELFHVKAGIAAKERALDVLEKKATKMFEDTFSTWSNKPAITVQSTPSSRQIRVIGKIYGYVDKGTRPHIITPKRSRYLSFRGGYKAKTSPGVLSSGSGGASGKRVFAKLVHHPGTRPRNFSVVIAVEIFPEFKAAMQEVVKKYVSG